MDASLPGTVSGDGNTDHAASKASQVAPPDAKLPKHPPAGLEAVQMQLVYQGLRYTVKVKEAAPPGQGLALSRRFRSTTASRDILKGLNGVIHPGRLTAVMGASGAGKTTMLNVLAGHQSGRGAVGGVITVNGEVMTTDKIRRISAYVHQEDVIMATQTVREVLYFNALLKLPKHMGSEEKKQRALAVADTLNLTKALNNFVGNALIKGISGGEKRRLSLAIEMITNPSILFLDEPTSGLDTYNAFKVACILRALAHSFGRTVVATIHQPSSEVFQQFDDLLVLAEGEVLFHGPAQALVPYFHRLGYTCPTYTNPADFLFMDILNSTRTLEGGVAESSSGAAAGADPSQAPQDAPHTQASSNTVGSAAPTAADAREARRQREVQRIRGLLDAWGASPEAAAQTKLLATLEARRSVSLDLSASAATRAASPPHAEQRLQRGGLSGATRQEMAPLTLQLPLLAKRTLTNAWRDSLQLKAALGQAVFLALVIGLIYLQITLLAPEGVQGRVGSLFFIAVQGLFGSTFPALTAYGGEKGVFLREWSSNMYSLWAYFWGRWITMLPSEIIIPLIFSVITYFLVGYQLSFVKFCWYALAILLLNNTGASVGIAAGCLFNNLSVAVAVLPVVLLPLMVFSGFFINYDTIPVYFKWISYISPVRYAYAAMLENELTGLVFECGPQSNCPPGGLTGEMVLQDMALDGMGIAQNLGILFGLMWGYLFLALGFLNFTARRLGK